MVGLQSSLFDPTGRTDVLSMDQEARGKDRYNNWGLPPTSRRYSSWLRQPVAYERRAFQVTANAITADATAAQTSACSADDIPESPLARAARNTPPKSPKTIAIINTQRPLLLGWPPRVGPPA